MLDKGQTGREASWAGGGILSPLHPWRYPQELLRLAHWSQTLFPDLANALFAETGVDPEWEKSGLLIIDSYEIGQAVQWGKAWHMELRLLSGKELQQSEPVLNPNIETALFLPEIAQIRNPRLLRSLRLSLDQLGVTILEATEVTGLKLEKGKITSLQTNSGKLPVNQLLITAGAWSGDLLKPTGIALPIEPVRGQMLLFQARKDQFTRVVLKGNRYLIPRRDGQLLVGSTIEHCGFDKTTTESAKQELLQAGLELAPELADCELIGHWAGLRPGSPKGVPYIGKHPNLNNLYLNAGHFRNGLMLAPACAELMQSIISGTQPKIDPAPYAPGRNAD